jgi:uncharacterized protein YegL
MEQPWGKKAVRIAIAVGGDADHEPLQKFIGHSELRTLQSNSPENLVKQIKWVSTVVLKAASSPSSQTKNSNFGGGNVPIPVPQNVINSASDVW